MRYTHSMEDAKRRAVEAIAQRHSAIEVRESMRASEDACGPSKSVRDSDLGARFGMLEARNEISRDMSVTNEKRQAGWLAVSR